MAVRDSSKLPPATVFLTLEEVAARWRRQTITTGRLLRKYKVAVFRIASKCHLYRLTDIEAIEEAAKHRPPLVYSTTWKKGHVNKTTANTAKSQKKAAKP
jgi:hypothetical protein